MLFARSVQQAISKCERSFLARLFETTPAEQRSKTAEEDLDKLANSMS